MAKKAKEKEQVEMFDLNGIGADWTDIPSGEFGETFPSEDAKIGDVLEGKIIDYKSSVGKNEQDLFVVKTKNGDFTVWQAAQLDKLFTLGSKAIGLIVRIKFNGTKKLTGKRQPMKLFQVQAKREK